MTDGEIVAALEDTLRSLRGPKMADETASALLPLVRRITAEELRAAAEAIDDQAQACDDDGDERGHAAYGWAAMIPRRRAALLDPS